MWQMPYFTLPVTKRVKPQGNPAAHPGTLLNRQEFSIFSTAYNTHTYTSDLSFAPKETELLHIPEMADLCNGIFNQWLFNILTSSPQQCYLRSHLRPLLLPRFLPAMRREMNYFFASCLATSLSFSKKTNRRNSLNQKICLLLLQNYVSNIFISFFLTFWKAVCWHCRHGWVKLEAPWSYQRHPLLLHCFK